MINNYIIPITIVFNSYIIINRAREIYQIIISSNFDISNSIYILLFIILNLYTILTTYSITKITLKDIIKNSFNIDNKIKIIKFIDFKKDDDILCPICYDDYTPLDNDICKLIQCKHIYHKKCIKEWYRKSEKFICPICQKFP